MCIFLVEIHQRLNTCGNIRDAIALLGVTDKSELLLCTKGVVRMDNSQSNTKNQILSIARDGSSTIVLEAAIVWARLVGEYLTTWNEDKLSVYRASAL